jgi:hypothetical protein
VTARTLTTDNLKNVKKLKCIFIVSNHIKTANLHIIMQDTNTIRELLFSPRGIKQHTHHHMKLKRDGWTQTQSESESEPDSKKSTTCTVVTNPNEEMCGVCLEVTGTKNVSVTSCGHRFCTSCLLRSLQDKNICPTCRGELETPRKKSIEQLNATTAAEIIQNEERDIDIQRRAAIVEAFGNGRKEMIVALCREFAFGVAHSIAGWQGTSEETYHSSWNEYEYNEYNENDDDDDDDDDTDSSSNDGDNGENENGDGNESDDSNLACDQNQETDIRNDSELLQHVNINNSSVDVVTHLQEKAAEMVPDEFHIYIVKHMLIGFVYLSIFLLTITIKNIM